MRVSEKVVLAFLGAVATLGAAAIAILPELLERNDPPGVISVTGNGPAVSAPAPSRMPKETSEAQKEKLDVPALDWQNNSPPEWSADQTIQGNHNIQIGHGSDNNTITVGP